MLFGVATTSTRGTSEERCPTQGQINGFFLSERAFLCFKWLLAKCRSVVCVYFPTTLASIILLSPLKVKYLWYGLTLTLPYYKSDVDTHNFFLLIVVNMCSKLPYFLSTLLFAVSITNRLWRLSELFFHLHISIQYSVKP
jgi:hypothetical protein